LGRLTGKCENDGEKKKQRNQEEKKKEEVGERRMGEFFTARPRPNGPGVKRWIGVGSGRLKRNKKEEREKGLSRKWAKKPMAPITSKRTAPKIICR